MPDSYYKQMKARLAKSEVRLKEDFEVFKKLGILIDFDDGEYYCSFSRSRSWTAPGLHRDHTETQLQWLWRR